MHENLNKIKKRDFMPTEMGDLLTSPAWKNAFEPNHPVCKLTKDLPTCSSITLNYTSFLCLCILWCAGDDQDRAFALFQCINPPGENQDKITINDKSWKGVLKILFNIATIFTYKQNEMPFNESMHVRIFRAMIEAEDMKQQDMNGFLDTLYGDDDNVMSKDMFI